MPGNGKKARPCPKSKKPPTHRAKPSPKNQKNPPEGRFQKLITSGESVTADELTAAIIYDRAHGLIQDDDSYLSSDGETDNNGKKSKSGATKFERKSQVLMDHIAGQSALDTKAAFDSVVSYLEDCEKNDKIPELMEYYFLNRGKTSMYQLLYRKDASTMTEPVINDKDEQKQTLQEDQQIEEQRKKTEEQIQTDSEVEIYSPNANCPISISDSEVDINLPNADCPISITDSEDDDLDRLPLQVRKKITKSHHKNVGNLAGKATILNETNISPHHSGNKRKSRNEQLEADYRNYYIYNDANHTTDFVSSPLVHSNTSSELRKTLEKNYNLDQVTGNEECCTETLNNQIEIMDVMEKNVNSENTTKDDCLATTSSHPTTSTEQQTELETNKTCETYLNIDDLKKRFNSSYFAITYAEITTQSVKTDDKEIVKIDAILTVNGDKIKVSENCLRYILNLEDVYWDKVKTCILYLKHFIYPSGLSSQKTDIYHGLLTKVFETRPNISSVNILQEYFADFDNLTKDQSHKAGTKLCVLENIEKLKKHESTQ